MPRSSVVASLLRHGACPVAAPHAWMRRRSLPRMHLAYMRHARRLACCGALPLGRQTLGVVHTLATSLLP
eukprot:1855809-Alexandrium_andersonii.AAC.1